ncbi:MAG: nitroreductase family protein [Nitrospirae bacterium]|nr:MAG: nitroreductase family protein [Nitrospirota bacterium]
MDIPEAIKGRRSIRKFSTDPLSGEMLETILEAGRWAPSGMNNQPWRFAVVRDGKLRQQISSLTHYARVVLSAPLLIPVFLDKETSYHREKDIQAIGACLQNMLLQIHALGLGAVWLGEILKSREELRGLLGLDDRYELMAVLAVGHPAESPKPTSRKSLKDLLIFEQ